ncbi:MAG: hypothetical protein PUJ80_01200 [Verrucomicrobiota bacterium]|nr:hypothetical protein [Verrucomicrobiota bacterium]
MEDKRFGGVPIELALQGALRLEQKAAAMELKKFDSGILAAGTAFVPRSHEWYGFAK